MDDISSWDADIAGHNGLLWPSHPIQNLDEAIDQVERLVAKSISNNNYNEEDEVNGKQVTNDLSECMGEFESLLKKCLQEERDREYGVPMSKHRFLRKGDMRRHRNKVVENAKVKRCMLEEHSKQYCQKSIVYSGLRTRKEAGSSGTKKRKTFVNDCAHTGSRSTPKGVGSAVPKGFYEQRLIESLMVAAANGNRRAQKRLNKIYGVEEVEESGDGDSNIGRNTASRSGKRGRPHTTEKVPLATCEGKTFRDSDGEKNLLLTFGRTVSMDELSSVLSTERSTEIDYYEYYGGLMKDTSTKSQRGDKIVVTPKTASSASSSSSKVEPAKRRRTELADVLSWYTDFALMDDDRFLNAADKAAWKMLENQRKLEELEKWLEQPEAAPAIEETDTMLRTMEVQVALSLEKCWADMDGMKRENLPMPSEPPSKWPEKLLKWWASEKGKKNRQILVEEEVVSALSSDLVKPIYTKYLEEGGGQLKNIPFPERDFAHSRNVKKRTSYRKFREWYFSKDVQRIRRRFLTTEVARLAKAWKTQWVQWKLFQNSDPIILQSSSFEEKQTRWGLISAFAPEPDGIQQEYQFEAKWGTHLSWTNLSQEQQELEIKSAMCDQLLRSIAERDGIIPKTSSDTDGHSDDDDDDAFEENQSDGHLDVMGDTFSQSNQNQDDTVTPISFPWDDPETMEKLKIWFSGQTPLREFFLKKEFDCAAKDFIQEKRAFTGRNAALRQRLTFRAGQSSTSVIKLLQERALSSLDQSMLTNEDQEDDDDDNIDADLLVEHGVEEYEVEKDIELKIETYASNLDLHVKALLEERRLESQIALEHLKKARSLYDQVVDISLGKERSVIEKAKLEFDQECIQIKRTAAKEREEAFQIQDIALRLQRLQEVEAELRQAVDVARIKKTTKEVVAGRARMSQCRSYRVHLESVEISCRLAQNKVLQVMDDCVTDGITKSQKYKNFILHKNDGSKKEKEDGDGDEIIEDEEDDLSPNEMELVLQDGKRVVVTIDGWDDDDVKEARNRARRYALRELSQFIRRNGEQPYEEDDDDDDDTDDENDDDNMDVDDEDNDNEGDTSKGKLEPKSRSLKLGGLYGNSEQGKSFNDIRKEAKSNLGIGGIMLKSFKTLGSRIGSFDVENHIKESSEEIGLYHANMQDESDDLEYGAFKDWYGGDATMRHSFLSKRISMYVDFARTMHQRGDSKRTLDACIFDAEESLEIPDINEALERKLRRRQILSYYSDEQLELDDESMCANELQGQEELEQELKLLYEQQMENMRQRLRKELEQEHQEESKSHEFFDEEIESDNFRFSGKVDNKLLEVVNQIRWSNGNGLDNGDEEYDRQMELNRANFAKEQADREREASERNLMFQEDESLKKFYIMERRALLLANEEREMNRMVELQREEERQRREHPMRMCERELLEWEQTEMTKADKFSSRIWKLIDEVAEKTKVEQQQEERKRNEEENARQEAVWRAIELRRAIEKQDIEVSQRELTLMGVEDHRSGTMRHIWEEERYRKRRLKWMESIAYQKFDPYYSSSTRKKCLDDDEDHDLVQFPPASHVALNGQEKGEEQQITDDNVNIDDGKNANPKPPKDFFDQIHEDAQRRHARRLDALVVRKTPIPFRAPLSNKFQQILGIPNLNRYRPVVEHDTPWAQEEKKKKRMDSIGNRKTEDARRVAAKRAAQYHQRISAPPNPSRKTKMFGVKGQIVRNGSDNKPKDASLLPPVKVHNKNHQKISSSLLDNEHFDQEDDDDDHDKFRHNHTERIKIPTQFVESTTDDHAINPSIMAANSSYVLDGSDEPFLGEDSASSFGIKHITPKPSAPKPKPKRTRHQTTSSSPPASKTQQEQPWFYM